MNISNNCIKLILNINFLLPLFPYIDWFTVSSKPYFRDYKFLFYLTSINCRWCTTISRLEQLEYLIIPHLQICSTRFLNFSRQWRFYNFVTVFFRLDFQAQFKFRIRPYLCVYHATRFLCSQNQMHT